MQAVDSEPAENFVFEPITCTSKEGDRVFGGACASGVGFAKACASTPIGGKAAVIGISTDECNLGGNYSRASASPIVLEVLNFKDHCTKRISTLQTL